MKKKFKKFLALLLATCITVGTVSVSSAEEAGQEGTTTNRFAQSKTAEWVDVNTRDAADVTLKVGGEFYGNIDVIFILGGGMTANVETIKSAINVFKPSMESGKATVRMGLISLEKGQEIILDLNSEEAILDPATYVDFVTEKLNSITHLPAGTTNLHSQLLEAKRMLAAETEAKPENKYVFVLATGRTYWFDDVNGEQATIVGEVTKNKSFSGQGIGTFYYYGNYHWQSLRGDNTSLYMIPATYNNSYAKYYEAYEKWINGTDTTEGDGDKYVYTPHFDVNDPAAYDTWQKANNKEWRDLYDYDPAFNKGKGGYPNGTTRYGAVIVNPLPTTENFTTGVVDGITYAKFPEHAMNYERAQYESIQVWKQLVASGYNCYSICSETPNYQNGSVNIKSKNYKGSSTIQVGHAFMDYLAELAGHGKAPVVFDYLRDENGNVVFYEGYEGNYNYAYTTLIENFFKSVEEDLVDTCAINSYVVDYIGKNENGNFEFVENADHIKMKEGNVEYTTKQTYVNTTDTKGAEGTENTIFSSYEFTANGATEPSFWLDYYYGDGETTERFVWTFGKSVMSSAPASLTYRLKLEDKQEIPGDAYEVITNNKAEFTPINSDGEEGTTEVFPIPKLYYPVEGVNITATKVWDDDSDRDRIRPASIDAQLSITNYDEIKAELTEAELTELEEGSTLIDVINQKDIADTVALTEPEAGKITNTWTHTWTNLRKFVNGKEVQYAAAEGTVDSRYTYELSGDAENGFTFTNSYMPEQTSVSVKKVWDDENNQDGFRPAAITVQLYKKYTEADGSIRLVAEEGKTATLNEENNWQYTWEGLWKNEAGVEIVYTVDELEVPNHYVKTLDSPMEDPDATAKHSFIIVNSHDPELIDIKVIKQWDDANNQDNVRPTSVTVQLKANGENYGEAVELSDAAGWNYTWEDLYKYQPGAQGEKITYTIEETKVEWYERDTEAEKAKNEYNYEDYKLVVVNKHDPFVTSVKVEKVWDDADNQDGIRPASVNVQLYADSTACGEPVTLNADNNWKHEWTGLQKNRTGEVGEPIVYSVLEVEDEALKPYGVDYVKNNDYDFTVINSYTPAVREVSVTKEWVDANNRDNIRPDSVTVNLIAEVFGDRTTVGTVNLSDANQWKYTWTKLPVYQAGIEIRYIVEENAVEEYTPSVSGDVEAGFVITNTHAPYETTLSVNKVWEDMNDKFGHRTESVEVQLLADGTRVGDSIILNKDNEWQYTWTKLPVNKENAHGEKIFYEVVETEVLNYSTTYTSDFADGTWEDGYKITVTNKLRRTSLIITKRIDKMNPENATAIFRYLVTGPDDFKANVSINFETGTVKVDGTVKGEPVDMSDRVGFDKDGLSVVIENLQPGTYTIKEYAARGYKLVQYATIDGEIPAADADPINGVQKPLTVEALVDNAGKAYFWNSYDVPEDYTVINRFSVDANGNLTIKKVKK